MTFRELILKLPRALVIEKKLDLAHLELKFMGAATAEANLHGWLKTRRLPKVDYCGLSVPSCFGPGEKEMKVLQSSHTNKYMP